MLNECVFYDLETTSAEPEKCRIVQMCFATVDGILLNTLVDPETVIGAEASKIHGITKDKLRGELPFLHYAEQVQEIIDDKILVGYNNIHFDSVVLDRELTRLKFPGLRKDSHGIIDHPEIDLFAVWKNSEDRDLSTAYRRFTGSDLENAHSADSDVLCLPGILEGMVRYFGHDYLDLPELSKPEGAVDREGKFVRREDGVIVLNFGKHKGEPVSAVHNYLLWMLSADFSTEVKAYCRRFLNAR